MRLRPASTPTDSANRRFYAEIWPHAAFVLRMATVLARNTAEAEDVAQEALLKAFRSIDRFEPSSNVQAWLLAVLRNAWVDRVRAKQARPESALTEAAADALVAAAADEPHWAEPDEILHAFGDRDIIAALRQLPDEIRWTLLLVDVQGLDHAEAADVLAVPVGTVKSRAHRGRAMLRAVLTPRAKDLGLLPGGRAHPAQANEAVSSTEVEP